MIDDGYDVRLIDAKFGPYEIPSFSMRRRTRAGPTIAAFWDAPQDGEENSMVRAPRAVRRTETA